MSSTTGTASWASGRRRLQAQLRLCSPQRGAPNTSANVEQSEAFLVAYAQACGHPWTEEELELAWAAGLWVRVFNAKKATLRPDGETPSPSRLRLEAEVGARLRQAGA